MANKWNPLYSTVQGDTWDIVAKKKYNSELRAELLMKSNPDVLDVFVFGAGTVLNCPEVSTETGMDIPEWRK